MYDELVKDLRENHDKYFARDMQAADAIKRLAKDLERSKEWETFWEKEANEALKKFQTTVASKPRWIPVTERLPRMWEEVMLQFPNNQAVGFHDGDSGWAVLSGDNMYTYVGTEEVHPTHWMPLPPAPKEVNADGQ